MGISSRFSEWWNRLIELINDQAWFQELRSKWEELDPQSQTYLKLGGIAGVALAFLIFTFSMMWGVHSLKREYLEKSDLLNTIQSANDEVRRLRETNAAAQGLTPSDWTGYFEGVAGGIGIDKDHITISAEKPGASNEISKESLFDIAVKHVNIKQAVRLAFNLENGGKPIKIRNFLIDTKSDPTGYLDATLSVSAFTVLNK